MRVAPSNNNNAQTAIVEGMKECSVAGVWNFGVVNIMHERRVHIDKRPPPPPRRRFWCAGGSGEEGRKLNIRTRAQL